MGTDLSQFPQSASFASGADTSVIKTEIVGTGSGPSGAVALAVSQLSQNPQIAEFGQRHPAMFTEVISDMSHRGGDNISLSEDYGMGQSSIPSRPKPNGRGM